MIAALILAAAITCADSGRIVSAWSEMVDIADYDGVERRNRREVLAIRSRMARMTADTLSSSRQWGGYWTIKDSLENEIRMRQMTKPMSLHVRRYWWCDACGNVWSATQSKDAVENGPPRAPVFRFNLWRGRQP